MLKLRVGILVELKLTFFFFFEKMSAETEMEKDEVKVIQQRKSLKQVLKEQWPVGIKLLELVSSI